MNATARTSITSIGPTRPRMSESWLNPESMNSISGRLPLEDEGQQGHLRPQAVLGLVEDDRARAVDDAVRHLLAAVGGQAVHEHGVRRQVQQRLVDLVLHEAGAPRLRLRLLPHPRPPAG